MAEPDYYKVLGVAPDSEDIVIQAAYRALMRRYHPDKNPSEAARKRTIEINAAYAVLGDPAKRAQYDAQRGARGSQKKADAGDGCKAPPPPPPPRPKSETSKAGPPAEKEQSQRGSAGGLIFAALLTLFIIGSLTLSGLRGADVANNTMNVDENLTTTDVDATDMNAATTDVDATDMNAATTDMNATDMNAGDANAENALSNVFGPQATHPDLSGEPTTAVDYSVIESAAERVAKIIATKGMAGARAYSEDCHKSVQAPPSWSAADSCAAFDYAAAYIDSAVTTQARWPKNGYFDFQNDNESDQYAAVGAPSYRTYDRLPKIKTAAQKAGLEAFRTEIARQETIRRMRQSEQPPSAPVSENLSD